jgi:hypothetical protein
MTEIDGLLERLAHEGPRSYAALPPAERAWRGRYLLMVAALGASPIFAWANALAPDVDGSAAETRLLVKAASDAAITEAFRAANLRVEAFLVNAP